MFDITSFNTNHECVLNCLAYNSYGQRMATCSSDCMVKVWDKNKDNLWNLSASFPAHDAPVMKVAWAAPEFGQVLASYSSDRQISIWMEELEPCSEPGVPGKSKWKLMASFVNPVSDIMDIKFSPKQFGLMFATCSTDGTVVVYEAPNSNNLKKWIAKNKISCRLRCSSLSWNPHRLNWPMLAVGSNDENPSSNAKILIYELRRSDQVFVETARIDIAEAVHDVAFSPDKGRGYFLLAVATRNVHLLKIHFQNDMISAMDEGDSWLVVERAAVLNHNNWPVRSVRWDSVGHSLVTSSDDGCSRVWKEWSYASSYDDDSDIMVPWACVSVFNANLSEPHAEYVFENISEEEFSHSGSDDDDGEDDDEDAYSGSC